LSEPHNIAQGFERIADRYDAHAALEQEVSRRLLERTAFSRREPLQILDLGCATGEGSAQLKRTFKKARIVGLDASAAMLRQLRRRSSLLRPLRAVCGDLAALPLASRSVDLVFSNLAGYWCADPMAMFNEVRRVLRPDGMLLISTLGPGTMPELRQAWSEVDPQVELPVFPDLLEIGDALMSAGFREPVMDMEVIKLSYPQPDALFAELEATGKSMLIRGWERWKSSREALAGAWQPLLEGGKYPLSFEIVYGVAYGPQDGQPVKTPQGDIATFSIDALRRTRKVP
jgi:malonyl-CoA O-methyltransferase